jgi:hypothetical protein
LSLVKLIAMETAIKQFDRHAAASSAGKGNFLETREAAAPLVFFNRCAATRKAGRLLHHMALTWTDASSFVRNAHEPFGRQALELVSLRSKYQKKHTYKKATSACVVSYKPYASVKRLQYPIFLSSGSSVRSLVFSGTF